MYDFINDENVIIGFVNVFFHLFCTRLRTAFFAHHKVTHTYLESVGVLLNYFKELLLGVLHKVGHGV